MFEKYNVMLSIVITNQFLSDFIVYDVMFSLFI